MDASVLLPRAATHCQHDGGVVKIQTEFFGDGVAKDRPSIWLTNEAAAGPSLSELGG